MKTRRQQTRQGAQRARQNLKRKQHPAFLARAARNARDTRFHQMVAAHSNPIMAAYHRMRERR